ncbi:unnamed protein product [Mytilus coruscus]|uniref:TRIM2_3 n=1 Tax=Mytilus coruscus TaxID=42192 RepID=A0A6J8E4V5_MYTCO|nr:unnamed protein product [Mytilus coruscus]
MNEVIKHIDELKSEIMDRWEALHLSTKKEEKEVAMLIGNLESKKTEVDDIIQSKDAKKFFVDGLGLVKSIKEKVSTSCTKFNSIPTFLPGQVTSFNIGSLQNISMKDEIKIMKQFDTEIAHIYYMTAYSEDTLWIADHHILQKVKIEGRSLKVIDKTDIGIFGIALTPSKDLLVVVGGSALKQICDLTGEMTDSKYKVNGFTLSAVHVNADGKVTVGAYSGKVVYPAVGLRRVVIIMDRNGNHESTYEYDSQGNPIFSNIKSITRTKNGNICVVDKISEDSRGRVMILSEKGDVLNIFKGHSEINTDEIPFQPCLVFTAPSDNIVVSSWIPNVHSIYFLNSSGNYIGWFDTSKIGILYPRIFCSTEAGHTYVGCVTHKGSSSKAKIYEVIFL